MATSKKLGAGTKIMRKRSLGAAKQAPGAGPALHSGQPKSMGGAGLKTGHSATNC